MLNFSKPLVENYDAVAGRMTFKQVSETIAGIEEVSEIVGLTIAELLPWDVENLQNTLSKFDIFN